jgi:HK97 family phage portal protein
MPIIRSYGALQRIAAPQPTWSESSSTDFIGGSNNYAYSAIYRTQPQVRTVVEFFSRNIAQLGIPVYRRKGDDDRERIGSHPLSRLLRKPSSKMTRYRLMDSTLNDLGVYMSAFWLKLRLNGADEPKGVAWLPARQMEVKGGLFPESFTFTREDGHSHEFAPSEIVHFSGYNPDSTLTGLSAIETLRRILMEDIASAQYRASFWRNGARPGMVIKRPREAGRWDQGQLDSYKKQMAAFEGSPNAGRTLILQDGMEPVWPEQSFRDSEFIATRKLTREEVAAAYHVPLPMVGILDHSTFSNIKEQHKHLYQDCLGPWLVMIEEEIERQLLPDFGESDDIYVEFNIQEKLKGTFEEQTNSLRVATGGKPIMTQNEGRARLNMPKSTEEGTDSLEPPANIAGGSLDRMDDRSEGNPDVAVAAVRASWARQETRLAKMPEAERSEFFSRSIDRWDRELAADLSLVYPEGCDRMASAINGETLRLLNAGQSAFDREVVLPC